ncbi:phage tail fiber protein [Leptospirillum ferriphilum]|uniref:phage tail fiber protein n=1 Tax=Leptospirillum ferriphilum TaxID=178606 RepID=UPI0009CA73A1|nr:hypothetical protein [Leptospirillum ferriphilum]OOH80808.1 hypothetical protein BOX30_05575 [Leptospirillum ferriphilum]
MKKILLGLMVSLALLLSPLSGALRDAQAGMSAYLANALAAQFFNGTAYTFPTTIYIGLYSTCPSGGTGGTEISFTGYARVAETVGTTDFTTASGGLVKNAVTISWTNTGSTSATAACYGAWDASTGGNQLFENTLTTTQTINAGATASFAVDALSWQFVISP